MTEHASSLQAINTPVGPIRITTTSTGLAELLFLNSDTVSSEEISTQDGIVEQLRAYFSRSLTEFTLPLDLTSASDFTKRVLEATSHIPYGETRTYGEIASQIAMPGATQAVGNALGANPIPIVIPCHRVVRADGSMGWFTGGSHIKRILLELEGVHFPEQTTLPF